MYRNRVIPCLTISDRDLIKTRRFKDPRYIGDPVNAVKIFNEKEVDEIMILDIRSSQNNKAPNFELINDITSECFMPICYGGAVRSLEDAKKILGLGVEKISLNTQVTKDFKILTELSRYLGAQAVVASIDYKKGLFGKLKVKNSKLDLITMAKKSEEYGAGEILLTSIDRDGMKQGYDLEVIKEVSEAVSIPVIACGGAGNIDHFKSAIKSGASAVAAGSMFVFSGKKDGVLISYLDPSEKLT